MVSCLFLKSAKNKKRKSENLTVELIINCDPEV